VGFVALTAFNGSQSFLVRKSDRHLLGSINLSIALSDSRRSLRFGSRKLDSPTVVTFFVLNCGRRWSVLSLQDSCRRSTFTRDFRPGLSHAAASRLELLIISIAVFASKATAGAEAQNVPVR